MLILASASPRRRELLLSAGIPHVVQPTHVPERIEPGESPAAFVRRLAHEKAAAARRAPGDIVLGADTAVVVEGQVLGKPEDDGDAARMLRLLSGRSHIVHTGICLLRDSDRIIDLASTKVFLLPLTEEEIAGYTRSGEPTDKAGAYAIQGLASKFVWSIEGCYHNVVGLPISLVYTHLKALGWSCVRV
jgi:septum formation protein